MCQGDNITVHFFCVVQFNISFFKSAFPGKASDIFQANLDCSIWLAYKGRIPKAFDAVHCNNYVKKMRFSKGMNKHQNLSQE